MLKYLEEYLIKNYEKIVNILEYKSKLKNLSKSLILDSEIIQSDDMYTIKTYIRALHKYESPLDDKIIEGYLVNSLQWKSVHASQFVELIQRLNSGQDFRGGNCNDINFKENYDYWESQIK